jgi:hypothetical protein
MPLEDLLQNSGANEPFLAPKMYLVEKADVTTLPIMTATPTTNAQKITRTGTFTMVASKVFNVFSIIPGKGDFKTTIDGGEQMNATKTEITVEVSGVDAAKLGWFKENKNKELIAVVPDRNGLQQIVGDDIQGCYITKVESSQGKDRGFKVTISYMGASPTVWAGTPPLV